MEIQIRGEPEEVAAFFRGIERKAKQASQEKVTKVDGNRPVKVRDEKGYFKPKKEVVIIPFSKHRRNKMWSPKEDRYLKKMAAQGRKQRLIAKDLGRTKGAVSARLYDLNHPGGRQPEQETRRQQPWTPSEESFLKRSIEDGATHESISRYLGRTVQAVRIRAQRKGWTKQSEVEA